MWQSLRNSTAHAILRQFDQEFVDRCFVVRTLLYQLIFLRIGYEGDFTNYGVRGWPTDVFCLSAAAENSEIEAEQLDAESN